MSDEKQETVIDVLAEMFELADKWCADQSRIKTECLGLIVHRLARRIKEALDRESKIPGNVMALRAALRELRDASRDFYHQILNSKYSGILDKYTCAKQGFPAVLHVKAATVMANRALVAPARNCDVGTAEEQGNRFGELCGKCYNEEEPCNEECPLASFPIIHGFPRCQASWAQMPYEAELKGGGDGE